MNRLSHLNPLGRIAQTVDLDGTFSPRGLVPRNALVSAKPPRRLAEEMLPSALRDSSPEQPFLRAITALHL